MPQFARTLSGLSPIPERCTAWRFCLDPGPGLVLSCLVPTSVQRSLGRKAASLHRGKAVCATPGHPLLSGLVVSAQRSPGMYLSQEHSPLASQWQTGSSGRAVLPGFWLTPALSCQPLGLHHCIFVPETPGLVCIPPILSVAVPWELLGLCTWPCPSAGQPSTTARPGLQGLCSQATYLALFRHSLER